MAGLPPTKVTRGLAEMTEEIPVTTGHTTPAR